MTFPQGTTPLNPVSQLPLKPTSAQPASQPLPGIPLSTKSLNVPLSDPKPSHSVSSKPKSEFQATLELHVLALGVLAHVQAGRSADASKRIKRLHTLLDSGVLDRTGIRDGVVEVCDCRDAHCIWSRLKTFLFF
jgi:hypothetical protein